MDPEFQPWFRGPKEQQPFTLSTLLTEPRKREFHSVACFPWTTQSLDTLWDGHVQHTDLETEWKAVAKKWMGAIAVGGTGRLYIFPKLGTGKPIEIVLSESDSRARVADLDVRNVAWAINSKHPLKPLIVFTLISIVLIYDVTSRAIVGKLRGHGGPITSLAVHPTQPKLFCTTSRDFTARIYDLSLHPVQEPNNPHWLPSKNPSLAGPAHGLHMSEAEGTGIGQCVAVMVGGRSGGHKGAAMCCAFHPSQPLIATGGIDRAVKVWRIPPLVFTPPERPTLSREDKPLFSTDLIHKARVLSVHWLADDILASCSAPALMRRNPRDINDTYWEDGTVVVWQWLGFNRFFPPDKIPQRVMRGTASDWRNSESFKVLSAYHLPSVARNLHVYRSLTHDPLLFVPIGRVVRIFNVTQFKPRTPPKFPLDDLELPMERMRLDEDEEVPEQSPPHTSGRNTREKDNLQLGNVSRDASDSDEERRAAGDRKGKNRVVDDDVDEEETTERDDFDFTPKHPPPARLTTLFDSVEWWEAVAQLPHGRGPSEMPDIIACVMGFEGVALVGIGKEGTLYVWRVKT